MANAYTLDFEKPLLELERHTPRVVMVDERNRPLKTEAAGGRGSR